MVDLESLKYGQAERAAALALAACNDLDRLQSRAAALRDQGHGSVITYSPKVFIPLTQLCRDVCHYCTFAQPPRQVDKAYLTPEEVLAIARAGAAAGCHEALFTLGEKPELRYAQARNELKQLGHRSTISYLAAMAQLVFEETGLLPHVNPGVLNQSELLQLRRVAVSQGLMLESGAHRLCEKGGPHYGSPDKDPLIRLGTLAAAGKLKIPFTTGVLIGIGETRRERILSLLSLREINAKYGNLQEIIIQNFRAKAGTKMVKAAEPSLDELCWTVAVARLIFGPMANLQAPPNLSPHGLRQLLRSGINDWGGVSPVTPDHVNPEAPWPHLKTLVLETEREGKALVPRLPLYPSYVNQLETWVDAGLRQAVRRRVDAEGYPRTDDWTPGAGVTLPQQRQPIADLGGPAIESGIFRALAKASSGQRLAEREIQALFGARGREFDKVCAAADELRAAVNGDAVSYVVNRNINYTNICSYKCKFCAFSQGRSTEELRGPAYNLPLPEIQQRALEAWHRGATEVCLQGGIHPKYTGQTYLDICKVIKIAQPELHIHAFSPLEIWQGAQTLGVSVESMLRELKAVGLGTLPGTAAEILDDEVRRQICPDKINTEQWLEVIRTAHHLGLRTSSTIMFGHLDQTRHWARHLLRLRDLQEQTGGFTEFVPLPFIHMESPLFRRGMARPGPTFRESVLMHALGRLVLHPYITNIQTSWTKMGREGALACLAAGANDLGGTLMDESISRAAGAAHGQELTAADMTALITSIGRTPRQRTTLYDDATPKTMEFPLEHQTSVARVG